MKWVIGGLFGLGTVAATCAAVLVAGLGTDDGPQSTDERGVAAEVEVAVAARGLSGLEVIDAASVSTRRVARAALTATTCVDPVQVVGHVLLAPMEEGQVFTTERFAVEGSAAQLAATIGAGQRAVSVTLADPMSNEDLLYPGCLVEVLFSRPAVDREDPLSSTLLQGVRVLGIGDRTIVAPAGPSSLVGTGNGGNGRRPAVSLLVTPQQAQVLKLAMQEGSVTLALRNPADAQPASVGGTGPEAFWPVARPQVVPAVLPAPAVGPPPAAPPPMPAPRWETVVIRGGQAEHLVFDRSSPRAARQGGDP